MSAPVWSVPTRRASMAALPCPRASTAGESAWAAAAWLLSGEEDRFSTVRSLLHRGVMRRRASLRVRVWLARGSGVEVARSGGGVGGIRAFERLAAGDLVLDPGLEFFLLFGGLRDFVGD